MGRTVGTELDRRYFTTGGRLCEGKLATNHGRIEEELKSCMFRGIIAGLEEGCRWMCGIPCIHTAVQQDSRASAGHRRV